MWSPPRLKKKSESPAGSRVKCITPPPSSLLMPDIWSAPSSVAVHHNSAPSTSMATATPTSESIAGSDRLPVDRAMPPTDENLFDPDERLMQSTSPSQVHRARHEWPPDLPLVPPSSIPPSEALVLL